MLSIIHHRKVLYHIYDLIVTEHRKPSTGQCCSGANLNRLLPSSHNAGEVMWLYSLSQLLHCSCHFLLIITSSFPSSYFFTFHSFSIIHFDFSLTFSSTSLIPSHYSSSRLLPCHSIPVYRILLTTPHHFHLLITFSSSSLSLLFPPHVLLYSSVSVSSHLSHDYSTSLSSSPLTSSHLMFQEQLQQMREMGITDEAQAQRALQATGGNIEAAIELIFGNPPWLLLQYTYLRCKLVGQFGN